MVGEQDEIEEEETLKQHSNLNGIDEFIRLYNQYQ